MNKDQSTWIGPTGQHRITKLKECPIYDGVTPVAMTCEVKCDSHLARCEWSKNRYGFVEATCFLEDGTSNTHIELDPEILTLFNIPYYEDQDVKARILSNHVVQSHLGKDPNDCAFSAACDFITDIVE